MASPYTNATELGGRAGFSRSRALFRNKNVGGLRNSDILVIEIILVIVIVSFCLIILVII